MGGWKDGDAAPIKEAQPTRTPDDRLQKLAFGKGPIYQDETFLMAREILALRAELEQVRQLRESDALTTKIEYGNALGRAEASESREKRVREAAEIALRQWMVNYALCAEDDIETAQHLEGQMYRAARRALEGE